MTLFAGVVVGALATWLVRSAARTFGMMARPNPIVPQHREPVALLGGVGIACGLAAALLVEGVTGGPSRLAFAIAAAGYLALGFVDDLRPMRAGNKLVIQTAIAAGAVGLGAGTQLIGMPALDAAISVAWVVLLVNAVNVTDVCDGLAAGLGAIGLLFLGALVPEFRGPGWGLAGACTGFLMFNRPPATIFMGDAGPLLVGFGLAAATMRLPDRFPPEQSAVMALAATSPFLFETVLLIWIRRRKGLSWWRGSSDHFSLRMQAAGLSVWRTDLITWSALVLLCLAAGLLPSANPWMGLLLILVIIAVGWSGARWLLRHEFTR